MNLTRPTADAIAPKAYFVAAFIGGWAAMGWLVQRWTASHLWIPAVLVGAWVIGRLAGMPRPRIERGVSRTWLVIATTLLALYAVSFSVLPQLVSTALITMSLACIALAMIPGPERRRAWALLPLAFSILPLGPSLDFFCAYPLRRVSGVIAERMLWGCAHLEGVSLSDGAHTVLLDAPCSGIRMLGVGLLFASLLALHLGLPAARTILLLAVSAGLVVLANALRTASLFLVETRFPQGHFFHTAIGLIIFAAAAMALLACSSQIKPKSNNAKPPAEIHPEDTVSPPYKALFLCSVTAAALSPLLANPPAQGATRPPLSWVVWPQTWLGRPLLEVPLPPEWADAVDSFPGQMAQFQCGDGMLLLRLTPTVSRALHESRRCYESFGWRCTALPGWRDAQGRLWSRYSAVHPGGHQSTVRECYVRIEGAALPPVLDDLPAGGDSWPDASSWFWATVWSGNEQGLHLAITWVESNP